MNASASTAPASANPPARPRHFASDNYAGICPEAFAAMVAANQGHEVSYGEDAWTAPWRIKSQVSGFKIE